jgi:hypothetical protein
MDQAVRQFVRQRARQRCEYCGVPQHALAWARFHVEHIRARQHGGSDESENLALACQNCNLHKGPNLSAIDPTTIKVAPLFNPRRDQWSAHFVISDYRVIGLTEVGRATVSLLNMNDPDRIQLRAELTELGEA